LVRWPGHVPAGAKSDRVSGFEDWMPTLLELVGKTEFTMNSIDGISMAPTLLGKTQSPRPFLYREFPSYGGQQSVRVGDWKAIRQNMSKGNLEIELYNLATDIGEQKNVAKANPKIVAQLAEIMAREHASSDDFPLPSIDN
ncbi:MAG: N-acetylgalactosamine-6-sulfatase, partial [bacterium]|nr:N-acetylgalactosamine-6-sulfatase [bacterium]